MPLDDLTPAHPEGLRALMTRPANEAGKGLKMKTAKDVIDLIDGAAVQGPRPATFADGAACQRVMDAARIASAEGRWVSLASQASVMPRPGDSI